MRVSRPCHQAPQNAHNNRAVVIGGGLAGIAAAVRLVEHRWQVCLIETRKRLGGRATSFTDPKTGQTLDNCQHVLMGCCTNLIDLYRRTGVDGKIEWSNKLYFTAPHVSEPSKPWVIEVLEANDLPAPMHMTESLMAFRTLTMAEKVAIARGLVAIARLGRHGSEELRNLDFLSWLKQGGQPEGAIKKFWSIITVSALNELPQLSAANYAMQVFQEGFLANAEACLMGVANVPLLNLYGPADRLIADSGGQLLLGAGAQRLVFENGRITAVELADRTRIVGDVFVSAVPFDRLACLSDTDLCKADIRLRSLDRFKTSPIIGIHLWFDRPVMRTPHLILTASSLQWLFNKGNDPAIGGFYLHGVISAAHDVIDIPARQIIEMVVAEVHKALPDARAAKLLHSKAIKEKRATFSVRPGVDRLRPDTRGAIHNLYLAGDWCRTGWPATMEGAVRSGYLAAAAVLQDAHQSAEGLVPDLPRSRLYRAVFG